MHDDINNHGGNYSSKIMKNDINNHAEDDNKIKNDLDRK